MVFFLLIWILQIYSRTTFFLQDHVSFRNFPSVIPLSVKEKDGSHTFSSRFQGFTKIDNLHITGHSNGAVNFWDASYPFFYLLFSVQQQVSHF